MKLPHRRDRHHEQDGVRDNVGKTAPDKEHLRIDAVLGLLLATAPVRREGRAAKQIGQTARNGRANEDGHGDVDNHVDGLLWEDPLVH